MAGRFVGKFRAGLSGAVVTAVLLWSGGTYAAETRVYLLRGWFGVFSTGLDAIAEQLNARGIKAEAIGHAAWRTTVSKIEKERSAGKPGALVLVGHSQGANNVIDMAQALESKKIPVDLLITLAPMLQDPVPSNVVRAVNFYQSPGWGAPLSPAPGFHGKLSNVNVEDISVLHINIDKSPRVQAEIVRAIVAVSGNR